MSVGGKLVHPTMSAKGYQTFDGANNDSSDADRQIVILVIGKSGTGKSSVCNTLLGEDRFRIGRSIQGPTTLCAQAETRLENDKPILIVDTPEVKPTSDSERRSEMSREVSRWKTLTSSNPTMILLTVRSDTRYREDDLGIYREVFRLWGDDFLRGRVVVAFTFDDQGDLGVTNLLGSQYLQEVLEDARGRYVVFNNMADRGAKDNVVRGVLNIARTHQTKHQPEPQRTSYTDCICICLIVFLFLVFIISLVLLLLEKYDIKKVDLPAHEIGVSASVIALIIFVILIIKWRRWYRYCCCWRRRQKSRQQPSVC